MDATIPLINISHSNRSNGSSNRPVNGSRFRSLSTSVIKLDSHCDFTGSTSHYDSIGSQKSNKHLTLDHLLSHWKQSSKEKVNDKIISIYLIHQAASAGDMDLVRQIIEDCIDVKKIINKKNKQDFSPLHLAARYNHTNVVQFLLNNKADCDMNGGEDEETPLLLATKYNAITSAMCLLKHGADTSKKNKYGTSALHFAARRGNIALCTVLLDHINPTVADKVETTPLHLAMLSSNRFGSSLVTKLLLQNGAVVEAKDKEGEEPIHIAAAEGREDLILLLAEAVVKDLSESEKDSKQNSFINSASNEKDTAIHLAAQAGYVEVVNTLISLGADLNLKTDTGSTPLHLAAIGGHIKVVELLVSHHAEIDLEDNDQMTPVHKACQYGKLETVECLQKHGARFNAKDKDYYTPLMCAVWKGQNQIITYLLQNGARIDITDINKKTVLHTAIEENHTDTLQVLILNSTSDLINARDKDNKTPLHYAAASGNFQAIILLLKVSADTGIGDNEEKIPLHIAAEFGKLRCVKLLAEKASINSSDEKGRSPLHLSAINGHIYVCETLIELGAETSCRDSVNWTPLDYAAKYGFPKTVKVLLDNGALVDACDKNGNTPLHLASEYGRIGCINMLLNYGASISKMNRSKKNCLDLAVEHFQKEACMTFIKHDRWREIVEHVDVDGCHAMEKLIRYAPDVAEQVLTHCITSKKDVKSREFQITYEFGLLDLPPNDQQKEIYFGPSTMVKYQRENLLSHPLTVKLVNDKWSRLGRNMYMLTLFAYLLYVVLLTSLVVVEKQSTKKLAFQEIIPWFVMILVIFHIGKEILQLRYLGLRYFKDYVNYVEIVLYTSTVVFIVPFLIENIDEQFQKTDTRNFTDTSTQEYFNKLEKIKWKSGALSILLAWGNFLLFLRGFPSVGLYVVMFIEVLKTVLSVLFVFSIFIVSFALSFYVLLDEKDTFRNVGASIVKTLVMMIGEFEHDDIFTNSVNLSYVKMSYIIFLLFLVVMPIVMINLLIGLAIGDIEAVRKSAYLQILKAQVDILKTIEETYPDWYLLRNYKAVAVELPNIQTNLFQRFLTWLGTYNYDSVKEEQREISRKEELLVNELQLQRIEIEKQKKKMKSILLMFEEHCQITKQIIDDLQIEDGE